MTTAVLDDGLWMSDDTDDESSENELVEPTTIEDEMDDERYAYPPGLMPSSEITYSRLKSDDILVIYAEGRQPTEFIESDTFASIEQ